MRAQVRAACVVAVLTAVLAVTSQPAAWAVSGGATEEDATWGSVKAMYRGGALAYEGAVDPVGVREPPRFSTRYPLRDSPANALEKLRQSYELMDPVAYLDCLAEHFIFYVNPEDVIDDPSLPEYWFKMDEAAMHENMFGEGVNAEHITLSFTQIGDPVEIPGADPGQPSQWEYLENYDLAVHLFGGLSILADAGSAFVLHVDPDEQGPGGEQLWEVLTWWDVERFEVSPVEPSTWGAIKALFQ